LMTNLDSGSHANGPSVRPAKPGTRTPIAASLAFLAVIATGVAFGPRLYQNLELAPLRYDVIGVDVSHHQGRIDWKALAGDGIAFAYIKATEGGSFRDADFMTNWSGAARAGLRRGAYHFFTLCRSGVDQARNFIAQVPRDPRALPPAIDAEDMDPCPNSVPARNVVQELETFLALVDAHYGRRPLIYTTAEFHNAYLEGQLLRDQFWIRSLVIPPLFRYQQWVMWQYQNRGRRQGVQGPLDLTAFRGSKSDFANFAQPKP
jgi:lysozyme